eukprot:g1189.t1
MTLYLKRHFLTLKYGPKNEMEDDVEDDVILSVKTGSRKERVVRIRGILRGLRRSQPLRIVPNEERKVIALVGVEGIWIVDLYDQNAGFDRNSPYPVIPFSWTALDSRRSSEEKSKGDENEVFSSTFFQNPRKAWEVGASFFDGRSSEQRIPTNVAKGKWIDSNRLAILTSSRDFNGIVEEDSRADSLCVFDIRKLFSHFTQGKISNNDTVAEIVPSLIYEVRTDEEASDFYLADFCLGHAEDMEMEDADRDDDNDAQSRACSHAFLLGSNGNVYLAHFPLMVSTTTTTSLLNLIADGPLPIYKESEKRAARGSFVAVVAVPVPGRTGLEIVVRATRSGEVDASLLYEEEQEDRFNNDLPSEPTLMTLDCCTLDGSRSEPVLCLVRDAADMFVVYAASARSVRAVKLNCLKDICSEVADGSDDTVSSKGLIVADVPLPLDDEKCRLYTLESSPGMDAPVAYSSVGGDESFVNMLPPPLFGVDGEGEDRFGSAVGGGGGASRSTNGTVDDAQERRDRIDNLIKEIMKCKNTSWSSLVTTSSGHQKDFEDVDSALRAFEWCERYGEKIAELGKLVGYAQARGSEVCVQEMAGRVISLRNRVQHMAQRLNGLVADANKGAEDLSSLKEDALEKERKAKRLLSVVHHLECEPNDGEIEFRDEVKRMRRDIEEKYRFAVEELKKRSDNVARISSPPAAETERTYSEKDLKAIWGLQKETEQLIRGCNDLLSDGGASKRGAGYSK